MGTLVNVGRSVPFIILMVAIVPLTRLLVGTTIGTTAAIVPLVVAAIPFMGRVVEQSLRTIDQAIADARAALTTDASSPYLNDQLNRALEKKVSVLRRVALLPVGAS